MKLKNGSDECVATIVVTQMIINSMFSEDYLYPMAFWDLARKCQDSNYKIFEVNQKVLIDVGLMDSNKNIHQSIKNIVLSSIEGSGLDIHLVNPIGGEND